MKLENVFYRGECPECGYIHDNHAEGISFFGNPPDWRVVSYWFLCPRTQFPFLVWCNQDYFNEEYQTSREYLEIKQD